MFAKVWEKIKENKVVSGAVSGAVTGTFLGGPVGTVVGAFTGGWVGAKWAEEEEIKKAEARKKGELDTVTTNAVPTPPQNQQ